MEIGVRDRAPDRGIDAVKAGECVPRSWQGALPIETQPGTG
jgi:hypothetical protein